MYSLLVGGSYGLPPFLLPIYQRGNNMLFTDELFATVQPQLHAIIAHPFNVSLGNGSLAKEQFSYYMQQDSLYLIDFARSFALLASKCTHEADIALMLEFAQGALVAERSLHEFYFVEFSIPNPEIADVEKGLACMTYTNYLLEHAALSNKAIAMAALLPCFWVYREVGNAIYATAQANNPYYKWIETYASQEFSLAVDKAVAFTNKLAINASDEDKRLMKKAFIMATRLEYLFWDGAYNKTALPL